MTDELRYRMVDPFMDNEPPALRELRVIRRTAKGAWVCDGWAVSRFVGVKDTPELRRRYGAKFALDGDGKRYAYETIELARKSYKIRKKRQIQHAKNSIQRAERALHWLETGEVPCNENCHFDLTPT